MRAVAEGADYIGFGPLFATPTKPDYQPIGSTIFARVHELVQIPIFCIGGIKSAQSPGSYRRWRTSRGHCLGLAAKRRRCRRLAPRKPCFRKSRIRNPEIIMSVLIVGSIALDTVKTPVEEHADQLGGSASYAALGASFFSPVKLVGVVGDDFPQSEFDFWKSREIDAKACSGHGQNISLVGRIRVGHEHARDPIGGAECLRKFPARSAGEFSRDGFCSPGQHRSRAAIACARSNGAAAFCRRRHDGPLD